jgi:uncharacterized protein (TIGR03083 family)
METDTASSFAQTTEPEPAAQEGPPPRPHVEAYRAASNALARVCRNITDWEASGLGEWTVRDLAGHVDRALVNVTAYLEAGTEPGAPFVDGPVAYYRAFWGRHDDEGVAERGRLAGQALGDEPSITIERDRVLAQAVVDRTPDDALLRTPVGTMTLAGYLPTRTFELAVHTADLARATGQEVPESLDLAWPEVIRLASELAVQNGQAVDLVMAITGRGTLPEGFTVL